VAAGTGGVTLLNCTFSANVAQAFAGAAGRASSQFFVIRDCTFSKNEAQSVISSGGGGLDIVNSPIPTYIRNSTFWGNFDAFGDANQDTEILGISGADIDYCCIQGFTGGGNNITTNPNLADVDGLDNALGTPDDNLQVTFGSSIIDVANDAALPADTFDLDGDSNTTEAIPFDIAGNPRDVNGDQHVASISDMSAYEFGKCQTDVGYDGPGHLELSLCGDDLATTGSTATLLISGATFVNQQIILVTSFGVNLTSYNGGLSTLVPDLAPPNFIYSYFFNANSNLEVTFPLNGGIHNVTHVYMQAVGAGSPKIVSNAIDVRIGN